MKEKPNISKIALGDVDFEKIDFEEKSLYVIAQVFNYGTLEDMIGAMKYYGAKRIREDALKTPWLNERAVAFLASYFNLKKEGFKCYGQIIRSKGKTVKS